MVYTFQGQAYLLMKPHRSWFIQRSHHACGLRERIHLFVRHVHVADRRGLRKDSRN